METEDTFSFQDIGDSEHKGELPESRSVDRQKTVSNMIMRVCEYVYVYVYECVLASSCLFCDIMSN